MTAEESFFALMRDARLSPHATSAVAAWLWSADGTRVLWANAAGASMLGAVSPAELAARKLDDHPLAAQVRRIAAAPAGGSQTEALHGFATVAMPVACHCSRIRIGETEAMLIVAAEPVQPVLPLATRVERLFAASRAPLAVFSGFGALLYATPRAAERLGSATTLAALGAGALMAQTIASGEARGDSDIGPLTLERMGSGGATVLVATLPDETNAEQAPSVPDIDAAGTDHASAPAEVAEPVQPDATAPEQPAERRHPLRFVWTMDAAQRFTLASPEFAEAVGPRTGELLGRTWEEIATTLALDPEGRVARAVASRDTWSGITVSWPVDGSAERITVELSGLPMFDRGRSFLGYRGFGVCRDAARLKTIAPAGSEASPPHLSLSADPRPTLTLVPAAKNVVPFRAATPAPEKRPALTPVERSAFSEIAATLAGGAAAPAAVPSDSTPSENPAPAAEAESPEPLPSAFATAEAALTEAADAQARAVLERMPVGILIHHGDTLLYANHTFLEWTGYGDLAALGEAGGLECLLVDPGEPLDRANGTGKTFTVATRGGENLSCEGRLYTVPWNGANALMLVLVRTAADERLKKAGLALSAAESEARELKAILDIATDGVVVVDREGRVLALNRSAQALFGYAYHEMARRPFSELFAPESERIAREQLDALVSGGARGIAEEVSGRPRNGALVPLLMTMGRIEGTEKFCAVLRDLRPWKRAEEELIGARSAAERASSAKSEFLAKVSHEVRTPLNAIIGFSEVMMEERFGAIGNERYREYIKDIHASGGHLVSLINDLLDLSKIEAGKLDLAFADVDLNGLVQQCVALMQPQANRERIIIRSSLSPALAPVSADARSVRQIVLNLLSNSIKFTGAGGQVIVSTAAGESGEVMLRVRDTGVGMTEKEIETAMEPFRQVATSPRSAGGTGLGLPLTKALAEANQARFAIKSQKNTGTLVEVAFSQARAAAE